MSFTPLEAYRIPRRTSTSSVSSAESARTELSTDRGMPRSQVVAGTSGPLRGCRLTDRNHSETRHKDAGPAKEHGVCTPEEYNNSS
ncbi:hypothetical protein BHM03_00038576 [Ensete ventricosum]|nr:hypothetical protein BHM03_00038576 [Ensete ventricosum]